MNDYMKLLGLKAEDQVTGFKGVVASICFDLYGCVTAVLTPPLSADGKHADGHWFDVKRLKVLDQRPVLPVPNYAVMAPGQEPGPTDKPAIDTRAPAR